MRLIITWLHNTKWQIGKVSSPFPQGLQAPTLVGLWLRVRGSQLPIHMFHWSFGLIISLELPETFYLLSYKTYKHLHSGDLGWGDHTQKPKWLLSIAHIMSHDKLERFYLLLTRAINRKLGKVVTIGDWLSSVKLHDTISTLSCGITWQIKTFNLLFCEF